MDENREGLCPSIMAPGRHWGPDRCVRPEGHYDEETSWHFGENKNYWKDSAAVKATTS